MNLPIPAVEPKNLVFFNKHMKLVDSKTGVRLVAESNMAKLVWNQMMNIYQVKATAMGAKSKTPEGKKELNKIVQEARTQWLEDQGVTKKGLIIYVAGQPCWRIDQDRVGVKAGFYDDMVEKIKLAKTPAKMTGLKRTFKTLQNHVMSGHNPEVNAFHAHQLNRLKTAWEVRRESI